MWLFRLDHKYDLIIVDGEIIPTWRKRSLGYTQPGVIKHGKLENPFIYLVL